MKPSLQLIGRFESRLSLPTVMRALADSAVRSRRFSRTSIYSSDHIGVFAERCKWGLYRGLPSNCSIDLQTEPDIAMAFGHPTNFHGWQLGSKIKVAGIIIEQDFVPPDIISILNKTMDAVWAPSRYVAAVYRSQGYVKPIQVFPHGVDPIYRDLGVSKNSKFTFLNVSGVYQERKGIRELIKAFGLAFEGDPDVELILVTPETELIKTGLSECKIMDQVRIVSLDEPLGPENLCILLNRVHIYAAPSKGEGFGLVPCESRACGIPVLITRATGHADHFRPEVDIEAPTRGLEWVPGDMLDVRRRYRGRVPGLDLNGLVEALRSAKQGYDRHVENLRASLVQNPEQTWDQRLRPLMNWLAKLKPSTSNFTRFGDLKS